MTRTGLLGGSFDPPHYGHLKMAEKAEQLFNLGSIIFIPAYHAPLKGKPKVSADHRVTMTELLIKSHPSWSVNDLEATAGRPVSTIHTVRKLHASYPDHEYFLLIGGDQAQSFPLWIEWQQLLDLATVVVFQRSGTTVPEELQSRVTIIPFDVPLSSTHIRDRLQQGESCQDLVPEEIGYYIRDHRLYS